MPDPNNMRKIKSDKFQISVSTIDFVSRLLAKNPKERLGSVGLKQDVKSHEFFKDILWEEIENLKVKPPFIPMKNFRKKDCSFSKLKHKEIGTRSNKTKKYKLECYKNFNFNDQLSFLNKPSI
jgi:hypothetical protein